jgi:ADP-ribose pyrophosphatase
VIVASPTYFRLAAEFHGRAAHAGHPARGRAAAPSCAAAHAVTAMPLGRIDGETTANVGARCPGGVGSTNVVPERAQLLAEARSLDAEPRRGDVAAMIDAVHDGAATAECDVDVVCEDAARRLPPEGTDTCRGVPEPRWRACAATTPEAHRTGGRLGRQRLEAQGAAVHEPRQRHRAQPRADPERVSVAALEGCSTSLACSTRPRVCAEPRRMSSRFERLERAPSFEGGSSTSRGTLPHEDGDVVTRQWVVHPGSVAVVAHDGERVWLVRQPREATGDPDLLELPAGKLDEEGESPLECGKRELAEEIGKTARTWEHLKTYATSAGISDELCHLYLATELSEAPGQEIADERIDIEPRPLVELDAVIAECRDAKTLIGLQLLRVRMRAG